MLAIAGLAFILPRSQFSIPKFAGLPNVYKLSVTGPLTQDGGAYDTIANNYLYEPMIVQLQGPRYKDTPKPFGQLNWAKTLVEIAACWAHDANFANIHILSADANTWTKNINKRANARKIWSHSQRSRF